MILLSVASSIVLQPNVLGMILPIRNKRCSVCIYSPVGNNLHAALLSRYESSSILAEYCALLPVQCCLCLDP